MTPDGFVTATEAARILGVSLSAVSRRASRGWKAQDIGGVKPSSHKLLVPYEALVCVLGHKWRQRYRHKTVEARKAARFWSKVQKAEGCWHWQGSKHPSGYGACDLWGLQYAHRVAWRLTQGTAPPKGLHVCHRCDVRDCVRPDHLFLGTALDNTIDAVVKGRRPGVHLLSASSRPTCIHPDRKIGRARGACRPCYNRWLSRQPRSLRIVSEAA